MKEKETQLKEHKDRNRPAPDHLGQRSDRADTGRGQEPGPERDSLQEFLDEGSGPLLKGGELRGDQQALEDEAQHGAVKRPTAHRGRDSFRRD